MLIDEIIIMIVSDKLQMWHEVDWNGWNGPYTEHNVIQLDIYDIEKSQKIIDEYIDEHSLFVTFPNEDTEKVSK